MYKKNLIYAILLVKNKFFSKIIWLYQKNVVPLRPEL